MRDIFGSESGWSGLLASFACAAEACRKEISYQSPDVVVIAEELFSAARSFDR
jgi:hypothetical protein